MATVDVVLTAGQSNMSGVGTGTDAPDTDPALCWDWNGTSLVTVDDPSSSSGSYKASTGSCVPSFVNAVTAASGRPIVIVRAAVGGTALLAANANTKGDWSTTGTRFSDSVTKTQAAITHLGTLGHTVGTVNVIWSQGHRDAMGGNSLSSYEAATAALVSRWRTALSRPSLKVYMELLSSTGNSTSTPPVGANWQTIRDAQTNACASTDGLEMAFTEGTDYYNRTGYIKNPLDGVHYTQVGLNYFGTSLGNYLADDQGFEPVIEPEPEPDLITSVIARRLMETF